jgi:hypothetical protein
MPRKRKTVQGYPYTILPVDQSRIKPKLRPIEADQFLLVETLLRTPKIIELYERDKQAFQSYWNERHGIFSTNPLGGSHHSLVIPDKKIEQKLREMGYVDVGLGMLDLGIVAKLPPMTNVHHDSIVLVGPANGGAAECTLRLQGRNPRFLQLHLDVSHPPEAIIDRLRPLLRARYEAIKRRPSVRRFTYEAVPKAQIVTKLKFFRCYDLQRPPHNRTIQEIAEIVYKDQSNTKGSAEGNTKQALARARAMIRSVADTGRLPLTLP